MALRLLRLLLGVPYNVATTTTTTTRLAIVLEYSAGATMRNVCGVASQVALPVALCGYCVAQLRPPVARLSVAYVGGAICVSLGGLRLRSVPCYAP